MERDPRGVDDSAINNIVRIIPDNKESTVNIAKDYRDAA